MRDRGHVFQPGENPLAQWYMAPEQRAAVVAAARAAQHGQRMHAAVARWNPGTRKLSDAAVVAIRQARSAGAGLAALADEYGVSKSTISRIALGHTRRAAGGPLQEPSSIYASRRSV